MSSSVAVVTLYRLPLFNAAVIQDRTTSSAERYALFFGAPGFVCCSLVAARPFFYPLYGKARDKIPAFVGTITIPCRMIQTLNMAAYVRKGLYYVHVL